MTKSEIRKARKAARTEGKPLTGELALPASQPNPYPPMRHRAYKPRVASREVQHARYLDCGPQNWDDR